MAHDCPNAAMRDVSPAVMIIPFASGSVKLAPGIALTNEGYNLFDRGGDWIIPKGGLGWRKPNHIG